MIKRIVTKALRHFGYELRRTSVRDAFTVQNELIKVREPVIFDVGAHVGSVAKKYRAFFPYAKISCFEPFSPSFEKLLQNLKGDALTVCHQMAVTDKKGTAILNANLFSETNSLLSTDKKGGLYWGKGLLDTISQVEVDTTTVDLFIRENEIPHFDILKLDVQGAEFAILKGATKALSQQKISLIYTELILCPTYQGQHKLFEYLSLLDSFGYEFLNFFNPMMRHRQLIQSDVVFLSSSFMKAQDLTWNDI